MAGKKNIQGKHVGHRSQEHPRKIKVFITQNNNSRVEITINIIKKLLSADAKYKAIYVGRNTIGNNLHSFDPIARIKTYTIKEILDCNARDSIVRIGIDSVGNNPSPSDLIIKLDTDTLKSILADNAKLSIVNIGGDDVGKNNSKETDQGYVVLSDE